MKVTCLCPTFNRVPASQHLLEECIQSFLLQDYKDSELIVLNDNPAQTLRCDAPGVVVINLPRRFRSLGEKYNAMVALGDGDLFAPWEDDDVSFPWRLSLSVQVLAATGADYYNPRRYWFHDRGRYHHKHAAGVGHSCSLFSRYAHRKAGGYPPISGAQDMAFDHALMAKVTGCGAPEDGSPLLALDKWFYLHRWDTGAPHLSGESDHARYYASLTRKQYREGEYVLTPHWRSDYVADTRALIDG